MPVVTHAGNAPLNDRWVLTLVPAGDRVTFANAAELEPALVLVGVAGAATVVVVGRARTVLVNGVAQPSKVAPGSGWPALVPGPQTVTVVGAATWHLDFPNLYL